MAHQEYATKSHAQNQRHQQTPLRDGQLDYLACKNEDDDHQSQQGGCNHIDIHQNPPFVSPPSRRPNDSPARCSEKQCNWCPGGFAPIKGWEKGVGFPALTERGGWEKGERGLPSRITTRC